MTKAEKRGYKKVRITDQCGFGWPVGTIAYYDPETLDSCHNADCTKTWYHSELHFEYVTDEPKEVGTLAEIEAQVGDVVRCSDGNDYKVMSQHPERYVSTPVAYNEDEGYFNLSDSGEFTFRIISRAKPNGPVRTVARKEIVKGTHGKLKVCAVYPDAVTLQIGGTKFTCSELDDLLAQVTAIRDALVENEG